MIYTAIRSDTGELLTYEDDPDSVVGQGESLVLGLEEGPVECVRVFSETHVVATDRRKRYDEKHALVRSDGRFSDMSLPTKESCRASGLPLAPHYNAEGEASFMNRSEAVEYGKRLSDANPTGAVEFDA